MRSQWKQRSQDTSRGWHVENFQLLSLDRPTFPTVETVNTFFFVFRFIFFKIREELQAGNNTLHNLAAKVLKKGSVENLLKTTSPALR